MNCKHIQRQLTLSASLEDDEREHLAGCDACARVAKEQRAVSRSLEMVAVAEPPIGSADRAFRAAMTGDPVIATPGFLERLLPVVTPFAAGAAAAAIIALLVGAPAPEPSVQQPDSVASSLLSEEGGDVDVGDVLALGDEQ